MGSPGSRGSPVQGQVKAPPAPAWLRMLRRRDMRCAGDKRSTDLRLWALLACMPSCTCAAIAILAMLSPEAPGYAAGENRNTAIEQARAQETQKQCVTTEAAVSRSSLADAFQASHADRTRSVVQA